MDLTTVNHSHLFLSNKSGTLFAGRSAFFPDSSVGKESTRQESWVQSERSLGERNDNSLHYSCLENCMDRGA